MEIIVSTFRVTSLRQSRNVGKAQMLPSWSINQLLLLVAFLLGMAAQGYAQISGAVYRDLNGNGTRNETEPVLPGVTINAYNSAGTLCGSAISTTVTTNTATANYTLSGCGTGPVRVEFVLPSLNSGNECVREGLDFSALGGANYGSSVQFVNGNSTNVNFAVHDPNDYNRGPDNTNVFVPCYVNGDPLGGGFAGTQDWFVSYPYSYSGITLAPTKKMGGTVIGAVWGLAYSKQAQKIFSSAFLKRHVGLGQLGTGGIYMIDPNAFTAQPFFDLDVSGYRTRADASAPAYGKGSSYSLVIEAGYAVGVTYLGSVDPVSGLPAGAGVVGTNVQRGLPASGGYVPNYDPAVFDQAGKVGLGDIDISDDGKFLFVTNLYSRKLIRMELDDVRNPQAVIAVESYDLPAINCNNGFLRPWALKYHRGKLYVGALCTGENNGKNIVNGASDMNAYVFELTDPTGAATFNPTPTLEYPLNFQKGGVIDDLDRQWFPWINTISGWNYRFNLMHPQPILSDIEFSDRGDMILGFTDRSGNQMGHNNYKLLDTHGDLIDHSTGGDMQIAGFNCATNRFEIENNGHIRSSNGVVYAGPLFYPGYSGVGNNQGPGGGEFFMGDWFWAHNEVTMGALAVLKGDGRVMSTVMDPLEVWTGGTAKYSIINSVRSDPFELYRDGDIGTFGKANGLGDLELTAVEAPVEIGNRVWRDTNGNGIQDAGEPPLAGATVTIQENCTGNVIASATTDANGTYYFSSATGTSTLNARYGLPLAYNTNYCVKVTSLGASAAASGLSLSVVSPTPGETIGSPNSGTTLANNDAFLINGQPGIYLTTGGPGATNHSYDFGFSPQQFDLALRKTLANGQAASVTPGSSVTFTITVFNQGNVTASNVQITDYIPAGLTLNDPNWTASGNTATLNTPIASLSASGSTTRNIIFTVNSDFAGSIVNKAEISSSTGGSDKDSTPDTNPTNDAGGKENTDSDNAIDGNGTGTPGDGNANTDEDDEDVALITVNAVCAVNPPVITVGPCAEATNTYSVTAVVTLNNTTAGVLTVSNGVQSLTTNVAAGLGTFTYTAVFNGLTSDGANRTITATLPGCGNPASANYTAPVSCTIAPICSVSTPVITVGPCAEATNTYSVTAVVTLNNTSAGVLTVSNGPQSLTTNVAAGIGMFTYTAVFNGLTSDGANRTITATLPGCGNPASANYTAPVSCAPICAVNPPMVTVGPCAEATNTYSVTAVVTLNNTTAGVLTVSNGVQSLTTNVAAGLSVFRYTAVFNGLTSDGANRTITAMLPGCGNPATANYTAPVSCAQPSLSIAKMVNKSLAKVGDLISYTVVVSNTASVPAANVIVNDRMDEGLTYVSNSPSTGSFVPGSVSSGSPTVGIWTIPTLPANSSATLVLTATVHQAGVRYNAATLGGKEVRVCTTVPHQVCKGTDYLYGLMVEAGRSSYQWYKDGVLITNATSHTLAVNQPGSYSVSIGQADGQCADGSCCPFILEENEVRPFSAMTVAATCVNTVPQANARIVLTDVVSQSLTAYQYQISPGDGFTAANALAPAMGVPANGILISTLPAPSQAQMYTVRLIDPVTGCVRDVVVVVPPTVCGCPPPVCLPVQIRKVK